MFCGEKPESKTKEHIIPKWLLELTGVPSRNYYFGLINNIDSFENGIPFNQFVFPACKKCNEQFGKLEEQTKQILMSILINEKLSFSDLNLFLMWLDKIRIGIWLANLYLEKNFLGIKPKFFIKSRINQNDRMLLIFKTDFKGSRINIIGANTPAFAFMPCCFGLLINNYIFVNISKEFLFSSRIGLPYPKETYYSNDQRLVAKMSKGRGKMKLPIFTSPFENNGVQIFQPMIMNGLGINPKFYESDYIMSLCYDPQKGIGKIFINNMDKFFTYPLNKSYLWMPGFSFEDDKIILPIAYKILETQNKLLMDIRTSYIFLDSEKCKSYIQSLNQSLDFNKSLLKQLR